MFCLNCMYLFCVHVEGEHDGAIMCRQKSEDNLQEPVLSLSNLGTEPQ